jgi:bifunctional oligoribonuclease and PAP phosphatase NrnA
MSCTFFFNFVFIFFCINFLVIRFQGASDTVKTKIITLDKLQIRQLAKFLSEKSLQIVIVSHVNPDGDAIGSSLGLYKYLINAQYQNVQVVIPNMHPSFISWMPNNDKIITANKKGNSVKEKIKNAGVIFCLDFNDLDRTEQLAVMIRKSNAKKVLIDHHPNPRLEEFDFSFSQTETTSTSELIYDFIVANDHKHLIDVEIAECIYAGIITDTGSLSYSCNYPETYKILAHLFELGIDGEKIHRLIYDTYSEDRMRLLGHCLSDRLVVHKEYKTAYIHLSASDLKEFNYQEGDTEGVVNYALSIEGIELAAIFIEKKDVIKISLRSQGDLDVNLLARRYYSGGGHRNAAGGQSKEPFDETLHIFNKIIADISVDDFKSLKEVKDNK